MMNNNPLVSICALSYNHQDYIKFSVESFINQDYKNIEIIALDDGSSDNSVNILNEFTQLPPPKVRVITQKNCGCIGKNFNTLLKNAKGKYVMFIALDDALLPQAISKKVEIMEQDENIQFVINSKIQSIDENNNFTNSVSKSDLEDIETPTFDDILRLDYEKVHSYFIQGCLFRKQLIDDIGGFDEDMIADDIVLRTKTALYLKKHPEMKFITLHQKDCLYRRHSSNISCNMVRQAKSVAQYLDRYHPNKKSPKMLKNTYRVILKQHKFGDFFDLLKIKRFREFIPCFPLWFISLFLSCVAKAFSFKK